MVNALNLFKMAGIVHSDFKPENILIEYDNNKITNIKIIDFGSSFSFAKLNSSIELTTPEYLAPDILEFLDSKTVALMSGGA
jgi:serine/threonine protein kinase